MLSHHCQFHVLIKLFIRDGKKISLLPQSRNHIQTKMFSHHSIRIMGHSVLEK